MKNNVTYFFSFSRIISIKLFSNSAALPKLVEMSTKVGRDPVVIPRERGMRGGSTYVTGGVSTYVMRGVVCLST
jgi:hypothetical protein